MGGGTGLLGGKKVIAVDGGSVHSLAVTEDGAVWATGSNAEGALGINSTSNKTSFTKTNITSGAIAVVAATDNYDGGKSSSYVLKSDGSVWAAGLDSNGQLGTETLDDKKSFVQVIPRGATAIAASYYTALALVDGSVYGTGNIKHLGFATDSSAWRELGLLATAIAGNKMIANVLAVSSGLFAVRGANPYGEFGLGNTTTQTDWTSTGKTPDYMGAGYYHTFYLSGGALYTTGGNSFGQLGRNGVTGSLVFGVSTGQGGSNVVAAAGGGFHTLILKNNGKVYGRGANSYGQIGMGIDVNWPDTWDAVNYDE